MNQIVGIERPYRFVREKEEKRHKRVRDRAKPLTCIHSVTTSDEPFSLCSQCITDRDEKFRQLVIENCNLLYKAVTSENSLDHWKPQLDDGLA